MANKTFTFLLMDAPFENARTATAFRLLDACAKRGHSVNVFAYEGAVALTFAKQTQHPNAVHGRDVAQEDHPLPKDWVQSLQKAFAANGAKLDWVNCGLCVDERGVGEWIEGVRRGTPVDFWKSASETDNTLVIATK
jgi:tRNA 2-thiouridine synthesizing protein D